MEIEIRPYQEGCCVHVPGHTPGNCLMWAKRLVEQINAMKGIVTTGELYDTH